MGKEGRRVMPVILIEEGLSAKRRVMGLKYTKRNCSEKNTIWGFRRTGERNK